MPGSIPGTYGDENWKRWGEGWGCFGIGGRSWEEVLEKLKMVGMGPEGVGN